MYTITLLALYIAYLIEDRDGDCQHVGGNVVQFKLLVKDWIRTQLHLGLGNFNLRIGRISKFNIKISANFIPDNVGVRSANFDKLNF